MENINVLLIYGLQHDCINPLDDSYNLTKILFLGQREEWEMNGSGDVRRL